MQLGLPFPPDEPIAAFEPTEHFEPNEPSEPTEPTYFVRHRRARRYVLRVDSDGRLRVTIPRGGSRREAEAFANRHAHWIARQRARLARQSRPVQDRRALREQALRELPPRLLALAAQHGLAVSRVSIRNQHSRWGSCGRDGHICLNWRLVLMPAAVSEYVLIHELMHLRRMDHSPVYWRLVAEACPGYREARDWLRRYGPSLR
jgi:predicted metal-dependent hydrolase